jgi:hypothetical protein
VEQIINHNEIITIEGNTSATDNSNGGQVQRRARHAHPIRGYGIPLYQGNSDQPELDLNELTYEELGEPRLYLTSPIMSGVIVKHVQQSLLAFNYSVGTKGPDGFYGVSTEAAVKLFQEAKGLEVDGWVGRKTWMALFDH